MKVYVIGFGLNESVCNVKQKWNHDEFRCELDD